MSVPVLAFFNNKGGVGKTTLVYHLAWMFTELDLRVLVADLDPQANLTAAFLDEDQLESLWDVDQVAVSTISDAVQPLVQRLGDIGEIELRTFSRDEVSPAHDPDLAQPLALVPGDLELSRFEDDLSEEWPKCLEGRGGAFRVTSAFWRVLQQAAERHRSQLILVDIGPNLGAINRAALISADHVAIPMAPDLFSLQGLRNLGPTLRGWRQDWASRLQKGNEIPFALPSGRIRPAGYILLQHAVRLDRPVKAYARWAERIPTEYRSSVLDTSGEEAPSSAAEDEHCLAMLKHYRSLMPMAHDARKPMFFLKPADGAIGSHFDAAKRAKDDFRELARGIAEAIDLPLPT